MKTKNNIREKVDDQVRRIFMHSSTILLSVLLISLTVNAQDFWEQFSSNSTAGKTALLKAENYSETETSSVTLKAGKFDATAELNISVETFVCETEHEKAIIIEPWMTAESYFSSVAFFTEVETEKALKVEDWMLNNYNFIHLSVSESVEFEKPLEIEDWMTDQHFWGF
jgi:hypothetical protein